MKLHIKSLIIFSLLLFGATTNAQTNLTGKEIQKRTIEATRVAGTEAVTTLKIIDSQGRERVRKIAQVSKIYNNGKTEKKLFRFLAPSDVKGTGFLTFDYDKKDDDKWLYMPALRKTRRIVSSENAKSFMGSEFSYADMTPPALDDYTYNVLGEAVVGGILCWKIQIIPADEDVADENGYSKKISYIGKDDFVLRKSIYYDLDEELHKELTVNEIKELDTKNHKYRLTKMVMENVQDGRKSILEVEKIKFAPGIKDEFFTTRYLERE